jgi:hypothetical protein
LQSASAHDEQLLRLLNASNVSVGIGQMERSHYLDKDCQGEDLLPWLKFPGEEEGEKEAEPLVLEPDKLVDAYEKSNQLDLDVGSEDNSGAEEEMATTTRGPESNLKPGEYRYKGSTLTKEQFSVGDKNDLEGLIKCLECEKGYVTLFDLALHTFQHDFRLGTSILRG